MGAGRGEPASGLGCAGQNLLVSLKTTAVPNFSAPAEDMASLSLLFLGRKKTANPISFPLLLSSPSLYYCSKTVNRSKAQSCPNVIRAHKAKYLPRSRELSSVICLLPGFSFACSQLQRLSDLGLVLDPRCQIKKWNPEWGVGGGERGK